MAELKLWDKLKLTLDFHTPLCGGVPRCDDLVRPWLEARAASEAKLAAMKEDGTKEVKSLDEVEAEKRETSPGVPEDIEVEIDRAWVGFSQDKSGLFVRGANLRAHLKDCAKVLAARLAKGNLGGFAEVKNFRAKFIDRVYIEEDRLHIVSQMDSPMARAGSTMLKPSGHRDAAMHVMTAQGPRTCLKRVDMIENARIVATVLLFEWPGVIEVKHIRACLMYGQTHGFGQDRTLGFGRYKWRLEE